MIIHVTGYPRSGTTWLSRLLADIYNCPLGGSVASQDNVEPASFGHDRESHMIVRKGHYMPIYEPMVANQPHRLNLNDQQERKIVHIIRHPLDLVVSIALYHRLSIIKAIGKMTNGRAYNLPPWSDYITLWQKIPGVQTITYEQLINSPSNDFQKLFSLLDGINTDYDPDKVREVFQSRSFANQVRADRKTNKPEVSRILNEGVSGRWKTIMNDKEVGTAVFYFGDVMEEMNYDWA